MRWISKEEVLLLHDAALQAHGGMPGLRDAGMLDSSIAQPLSTFDGKDLYGSTIEKAAMLGFSLISNHPFVDGNKRVGFAAMAVALLLNGQRLECRTDEGETVVLGVASGTIDWRTLAAWVEEHSYPVR